MNETVTRLSGAVWREGQPLGTYLVRVARLLEERLDATLSEVGLSPAKLQVLTQLVEAREPVALSELAARMCCVRSNVTQLIDRMETDGLVRRVDDPADRRAVRAELTTVGRERQAEGAHRFARLEEELQSRLDDPDREALVDLLGRLV
jgi:DNA-binding MarR family transcriptional regulator